jgi:hypothetical protein
MALQIALSDSPIGAAFPAAYARIPAGRSLKDTVHIQVDFYADEAAKIAEKQIVKQLFFTAPVSALDVQAGDHPHAPYYRYLKTLPDFEGALDV